MSQDDRFGAASSTFSNIFTFMGLPLSQALDDDVDAVVLGVPYDLATTGRPGARFGPNGVRQASATMRWEKRRWPWDFALAERLGAIDYGDISYETGQHEDLVRLVTETAGRVFAAGKKLVTLGGDHFVTLPLLRAAAGVHGRLALIHFDAHTDTDAEEYLYNHGSMFYHAPREGLIDPDATVQVGIRTEYPRATHPFHVMDANDANNMSVDDIVSRIETIVGDRPAYLSFDIDCLDPAFAPGTGTPVAGGMTSNKALQIIRRLGSLNLVGMDVMEVAPAYDHADVTSIAGATVVLEMLYLIADRMARS